ncbi:unnamed protein product [Schistocephalus solidus]|uniref:LSDAT_euk domain-containing protein n=1 Tax=Schistocephalus solidus TaxID=70667 RepID=A0A183SZ98_SCHSO|nr:unnamed protein product [Schistocephalus solidus]
MELACTSKALVSMNGFDWEPANEIGRRFWMHCFHRYAKTNEKPSLPFVSIISWGDITDRHQIAQKASVVDYAPNTMDGLLPSLNRYQRLFLMVDDGLRFCHAESKCDSFRVVFEKMIEQHAKALLSLIFVPSYQEGSKSASADYENLRILTWPSCTLNLTTPPLSDKDNEVRSSVAVLIGGDLTTLRAAERRLSADIPVVICTGTGGLADVLAYFNRCGLEKETWQVPLNCVLCHLPIAFIGKLKQRLFLQLRDLQVPEPKLEETASRVAKLLFSENMVTFWDPLSGETLADAVIRSHTKCTPGGRINETLSFDQFTQQPDLEHVLTCLRAFNMKLFKHPLLPLDLIDSMLFMASVYLGRVEMAEYFWTFCQSPLCLALIASCIFRRLGDSVAFDRFQTLANAVAEEGFSINVQASIDLVGGAVMASWGSPTVLELAASAECKYFTSSRPAQQAINYLWSGGLTCNVLVNLLALLCPPILLFPRILHFPESYAFGLDQSDCQVSVKPPETFFERLQHFYSCPRTKFCWSFLVCLFFLVICSATLLLPLQPKTIGHLEISFMVLISLRLVGSVLSLIAGFQWAWIQCLSASVAIIYMLLRIWGSTTFTYAYSMAVIVLVLFAVELLLYCYVSVILGPKVTMIGQMTWEMIAFLPFFLIFLLVFGVTEQAAIFPDRTGFDTSVVLTVLERPFYRLFGENALEDSRGEGTSCTDPATSTGCPQQSIFAVVSIGMYNLLTVILLMNLLIAIFRLQKLDEVIELATLAIHAPSLEATESELDQHKCAYYRPALLVYL